MTLQEKIKDLSLYNLIVELKSIFADISTSQVIITTSTSITASTKDKEGNTQDGKNVVIDNGANVINYTVDRAITTTSFMKLGTGVITFIQGSGRTLVTVDGTATFNGIVGSTATITSVGTVDYLRISNA